MAVLLVASALGIGDSLLVAGAIHHKKGEFQLALRDYKNAIKQDSSRPDPWFMLGMLYDDMDSLSASRNAYQRSFALKPQDPKPLFNIAITFERQKALDSAIIYYKKALKIDPDYAKASFNAGLDFEEMGLLDSAEVYLKKSIASGENPQAWYRLALVYARQNRNLDALIALAQAFKLRPDYRELAAKDPGFADLHDDVRFLDLMEGN